MKVFLLCTVFTILGFIGSLRVVPERAALLYINEKYIENATVFITRYGRSSPYYFNIIGRNKHTWDNNVTVNLVFYEYLHNEYKRSFVEIHKKLCDLLTADPYVGAMVANVGIKCPVYPNMQHMENMTIPATDFKYVIPFKKVMAQLEFTITATGESMAKADFYVSFVDKKRNI